MRGPTGPPALGTAQGANRNPTALAGMRAGTGFPGRSFTPPRSVPSAPSPTPPPYSVNQTAPLHNLPQGAAFVRGLARPHAGDLLRDVNGVYRNRTPVAAMQVGPFRS